MSLAVKTGKRKRATRKGDVKGTSCYFRPPFLGTPLVPFKELEGLNPARDASRLDCRVRLGSRILRERLPLLLAEE